MYVLYIILYKPGIPPPPPKWNLWSYYQDIYEKEQGRIHKWRKREARITVTTKHLSPHLAPLPPYKEIFTFIHFYSLIHQGQTWPGKGPLGSNSIPGQRWPENRSTGRGIYDPELGQADLIICQICTKKLTDFRVIFDQEWSVWPRWTLFRVTLTQVF